MPKRKTRKLTRRYQVFVSHATADKWLRKTICEKIEAQGAHYFRDDHSIEHGDSIPDAIRRAIKRADELLVLLTPESVDRPWVLVEVGAKWGQRIGARIVAILCHVKTDRIPAILAEKRACDINEFDAYLESLNQRVKERQR